MALREKDTSWGEVRPCVLHRLYHTTPQSQSSVVVLLMLLFIVFLLGTFPSSPVISWASELELKPRKIKSWCAIFGVRNCDFFTEKGFSIPFEKLLGFSVDGGGTLYYMKTQNIYYLNMGIQISKRGFAKETIPRVLYVLMADVSRHLVFELDLPRERRTNIDHYGHRCNVRFIKYVYSLWFTP